MISTRTSSSQSLVRIAFPKLSLAGDNSELEKALPGPLRRFQDGANTKPVQPAGFRSGHRRFLHP
jgi:hypothetical protein